MPFCLRADITDDDLNVVSSHEFYGATPEEAEQEFESHLAASQAMRNADKGDLLILGDVEEIGEDELPEVQEDDDEEDEEDEDEEDGSGVIEAEAVRER